MSSIDELRAALPHYQSHKVVQAAMIVGIAEGSTADNTVCVWLLEGGRHVGVTMELASRVPNSRPMIGGYYVLYPDGFESWSPADAFEGGYTRVNAKDP